MTRNRMRIRISPWMLAAAAIIIFGEPSGIVCMTFLAAILHECGHLLAARALGLQPQSIEIGLSGARLRVSGGIHRFSTEWLLAAAGPLASLLLALVALPLWSLTPTAQLFSVVSASLGLLNLLPVRSFDGGRMLSCTLEHFLSLPIAARLADIISFLCLFLLWAVAVYFLLRAADGLSLFCFSFTLLLRFFDGE